MQKWRDETRRDAAGLGFSYNMLAVQLIAPYEN